MTYRSNRWPCGLRRTVSSLLVGVMMSSVALAQQTAGVTRAVSPATDDGTAPPARPAADASRMSNAVSPVSAVSMEEMTAIIKRLEERVKELETKLDKSGPVVANVVTAKAVKPVEQDMGKMDMSKTNNQKSEE